MTERRAIIIGAGPAGLTAAYELLLKTDIKPIIIEATDSIGGISKTVNYKGNRIDIGGHRFFSKSDIVMNWWINVLPVQGRPSIDELKLDIDTRGKYFGTSAGPDPERTDDVMLIRNRISRIFFLRKFFDYPISLNIGTLLNLGLLRLIKIGYSYLFIRIFPIKNEKSLADFFKNRFGNELYKTFFKDYTEKVWGVPCEEIKPEWGAQRVKGLSITKTIVHAVKKINPLKKTDLKQKEMETSLIEKFMYPKYGPGQLWEEVAKKIEGHGGVILKNNKVISLDVKDEVVTGVTVTNNGLKTNLEADYYFSSMPVKDLILSLKNISIPYEVRKTAEGLAYRDFITVGLLVKKLKIKNRTKIKTINNIVPDNWIYMQEKNVKIGRLQIFNNWSPYMVCDLNNVWIGLEYFCNEGDDLWCMKDEDFIEFAIRELVDVDIINNEDVLDHILIRVPKTYPAYIGTYGNFNCIIDFSSKIKNLFLIGRNGMHRYNNMDHSMLTAMVAVDNIINNVSTKDNIWEVNSEEEYHEEK
jgi:protoporphyrinogen oxidase